MSVEKWQAERKRSPDTVQWRADAVGVPWQHVLYHMLNPAELIHLISKRADKVLIWTHYYDQSIIQRRPDLSQRFSEAVSQNYFEFDHTLYKYQYQDAISWTGFCGGNNPYSYWMSRDDILSCLKRFGFDDLRIRMESGPQFDERGHPAPYAHLS